MSTTALEAIGKVFTDEVLDVILREGLKDYYDVVNSFQKDKGTHPEDFEHNKEVLTALRVVLQDFMSGDEWVTWLKRPKDE
jgi:hypothetical protein